MKKLPVAKFMEREPLTARPEMPLTELVALMARHRVRGLPVVDDEERLVGVVSETDLFLKEKGVPFSLEKVPTLLGQIIDEDELDDFEPCRQVKVAEVMTEAVASIDQAATLERVSMMMYERNLTLLPVVSEQRLVGVARRIDVLKLIYAEHE